jgi:hypothetical protein
MKKILLLLIMVIFAFSGCKFINERGSKKGGDTLEVYVYNLEQQLANYEKVHQASLNEIMRESQAKIDSIINYYESEISSRGGRKTSAMSGTYYLVVGSFQTPAYAQNYSAKVSDMGYKTEIVESGYWNFVSAESYTDLREAIKGLSIVRSNVTPDSWILVGK